VKREKPGAVVLINPNNPDGGYLNSSKVAYLLRNLRHVECVILDESFIHFVSENDEFSIKSFMDRVEDYPNLIVIKSMSKDFGIAGLRVGYAVMNERRVSYLLKYGFLWNISGLAEFFLELYTRKEFWQEYEKIRIRYIIERNRLFSDLSLIKSIKVYPSSANFFLVEIIDGSTARNFAYKLLLNYGIYVRLCNDKIGLDGEFVRIASRKGAENKILTNSIAQVIR
jgi:histidinol-phosphate/aromatic aminotransferase/cobyric acid decarboxylase-like protein